MLARVQGVDELYAPRERLSRDRNEASRLETIVVHGAQGLTGRLSDELGGGAAASDFAVDPLMAQTGGKPDIGPAMSPQERKRVYTGVRDLIRERQRATAAARPVLAAGSELVTGLVAPGAGLATTASKLATPVVRTLAGAGVGALLGTATGIGAQDSGMVAKDGVRTYVPGLIATPGQIAEAGAVGGVVGAATGAAAGVGMETARVGVRKLKDVFSKPRAQEAVDNRVLRDAVGANEKGGAAKSIRDPIGLNRDLALDVIKAENIVTNPRAPASQVATAKAAATRADAAAQTALGKAKPMDANEVIDNLRKVQGQFQKPENQRAVQRTIDAIEDRYVPQRPLTDDNLLRRMSERAKGQTREKIGADAKNMVDVAKRYGLDKTVREPAKHAVAAEKAVSQVGTKLGQAYKSIEKTHHATNPLTLPTIVEDLLTLHRTYDKNPAPQSQAQAGEVMRFVHFAIDKWGGKKALEAFRDGGLRELVEFPVPVRPSRLRETISTIQAKGFSGSQLDPSLSQAFQRDLAGAAKGTLNDYLDFIGERAAIDKLNFDFSRLKTLQKAARQRAAQEPLRATPAIPKSKTGKIPAKEVVDLSEQLAPRPPSIQSQRAAVQVRPKLTPSEGMAKALRDLIDSRVPAVRTQLQRREMADLLQAAGIAKQQSKPFTPDFLEGLAKDPRLDLGRAPLAGAARLAYEGQKLLEKRVANKKPSPPGTLGKSVRKLIQGARRLDQRTDLSSRTKQSIGRQLSGEAVD